MATGNAAAAAAIFETPADVTNGTPPPRPIPGAESVLAIGFGMIPVVAFFAAPAVVPILSVLALVCLVEAVLARRFAKPLAALIALPAVLWAGATIFWSIAPGLSGRIFVQLLGAFLAVAILLGSVLVWDRARRARLLHATALGLLAATAILAVDLALSGGLTALIKGWNLQDEEQAGWAVRNGNRGVALMTALVWPAVAGCFLYGRKRIGVAVLVAVTIAVLLSSMTNAKLAMLCGLVFLGGACWLPRASTALLAAGMVGWTLLAPVWIAALPDPYQDKSIINRDASLLHRVIIWKFVAERIGERPLLGWGLETARAVPDGGTIVSAPYHAPSAVNQTDFMLLPLHPHNAPLQWWLELGAAGMLLMLAIPLQLVRRTRALGAATRPFALAALGSGFCISAASFGAWQAWWLFTMAFCAVLFAGLNMDKISHSR